ncbi:MAG TPA: DUF2442 domain-containing protein [Candidatus Acidoferrum sp.]|nr:DUF2442 domain-containing protein [Candidatus Acidoferrum sp.]
MPGTDILEKIRVTNVISTRDTLTVDFDDGRSVSLPLMWFPRLFRATQRQRDNWELLGRGFGVHWLDLDEDLSAKGLALGWPSVEFLRKPAQRRTRRQKQTA